MAPDAVSGAAGLFRGLRRGIALAVAGALALALALASLLLLLLLERRLPPELAAQVIGEARLALAAVVLFAALLVAALTSALLSRRVLPPLAGLADRFREVREGSLDPREAPAAAVREEIGALHLRFEEMLAGVRELHRAEVAKERELTAHQQERHYRGELEAMNLLLNARIAELGQANEQINRLALQLEEKNRSLGKAVKDISALNRVGVLLSSELDIDRLVQLLINISVKGLRVEIGFIMLFDERHGQLAMRGWSGLGRRFDATLPVAPGESVSGLVAQTGKALLIRHVDGSQGIKTESRYGFTRRSVLCVPIRMKDRLLGTIELTNKKGEESFTEDDLEMIQSIANQAAVALENAGLYREVQRSYLETIRALVQAVEEKDKYTRGHSERVTTFSVKIAQRMGLQERQVQMIQYAGVLHDIGKIGIDLAILQKTDRLTQEEFTVVKNHPLIGARIIRPIGFLADVIPGVSQHHERFDGCGYPQGLRGEQMTLEARILAVADAYDAMITERPYRKPLPKRDAVAELQRCSGTQFDPVVVEHFLELLETDEEIHRLEERLLAVGT